MVQTLEVKASDKHLLVVNEENCWLDVDGTVLLGIDQNEVGWMLMVGL